MNQCIAIATKKGMEQTVIVGLVSTAAVTYFNQVSPRFRNSMGISGKVATVMSPIVGAFFLVSELTLHDVKQHPENYGLSRDGAVVVKPVNKESPNVLKGSLAPHHRAMNWAYDHPFHLLAACAVPLVGSIYFGQSGHEHLKLSQKIMHTRVLGQASVVSMLLAVMFFRDYMERHGRFKSLEEIEAEKTMVFHTDQDEAQELIKEAEAFLKTQK